MPGAACASVCVCRVSVAGSTQGPRCAEKQR